MYIQCRSCKNPTANLGRICTKCLNRREIGLTRRTLFDLNQQVQELNTRFPVGTSCRWRTGGQEGSGQPCVVVAPFGVKCDSLVAWVNGASGYVFVEHLEFEELDRRNSA